MADKFISMRNLKFLLNDVFDVNELTKAPYFSQHNEKTVKMILDEALKLGSRLLHPLFEEMDRKPPEFVNGEVQVHPLTGKILSEFGKNGWISASFPTDHTVFLHHHEYL